jgi:hypothetical protein
MVQRFDFEPLMSLAIEFAQKLSLGPPARRSEAHEHDHHA